jgi:putative transposase
MKLAYKYKLKPTVPQRFKIVSDLELARRQYNFRLGQRFDWYEATRSQIDRCPLNVSIVSVESIYQNIPFAKVLSKGKNVGQRRDLITQGYVDWATVQKDDLPNTKKLFPEYKSMHSQVLQNVLERVQSAFERFTKPDKSGKRSGRPKFKGKAYYNSFTYPQMSNSDISKDEKGRFAVRLPKIGMVPFVFDRPIPDGFEVKTGTIIREADGFYICFALVGMECLPGEASSGNASDVPVTVAEIQPTLENSIGIDLGLEYYAALSTGETVEFPRWLRRSAEKLATLQRRKEKQPHGSKSRCILAKKIAKVHQTIARQRLDWQFKLAYWLFSKCDVLICEDLKLKGLSRRCKAKPNNEGGYNPNGQAAKSGLNKSLLDAAHGQFVKVLEWVAFKTGKTLKKIDPRGTSQHCHACLNRVNKTLGDRWHERVCGESLSRDVNSGKLIQRIGVVGKDITSLKTAMALSVEEPRVLCVA